MLGEVGASCRGFVDHLGDGRELRIILDGLGQNFDRSRDHRQDIVEIMCDSASELADGFHFFGLPDPVLRRDLVGEIADESVEHHAVTASQRGDAQFDLDFFSVASPSFDFETASED